LRQTKADRIEDTINAALAEAAVASKRTCSDCGDVIESRGAWGRCSRHYQAMRRNVIKEAAIRAMGGECGRCGAHDLHTAAYDFHHNEGGKTATPASLIGSTTPRKLAEELAICELLCANCHRAEHADEHA
jgi:5-methylcytosine-specific restriction endonuclease McrA